MSEREDLTDEERAFLQRLSEIARLQHFEGRVLQKGLRCLDAALARAALQEELKAIALRGEQAALARAAKAEESYRWMVERAADQKLDGYRELGARAAAAEQERDAAREEAKRNHDDSWTQGTRADEAEAREQALRAAIDAAVVNSSIPATSGEKHPLFESLETLSTKLCQSHAFILRALDQSGLALVSSAALSLLRAAQKAAT